MISAPNSAGTNSANCAKLLCSRSTKFMRWLRVDRAFGYRAQRRTWQQAGGRSISRPPLHIEDGASMAFRADEPFTSARVPQAEGTAADRTRGKADGAPRALTPLPRGDGLADLALFIDRELRLIGAHQSVTVTTTLPNCCPAASRSNARRPCSSGYSESTGGHNRPARSSSTIAENSVSLPMVDPMIVH